MKNEKTLDYVIAFYDKKGSFDEIHYDILEKAYTYFSDGNISNKYKFIL